MDFSISVANSPHRTQRIPRRLDLLQVSAALHDPGLKYGFCDYNPCVSMTEHGLWGEADLGLQACFSPHSVRDCGLTHHYLLPASLHSPLIASVLALPQSVLGAAVWAIFYTTVSLPHSSAPISQLPAQQQGSQRSKMAQRQAGLAPPLCPSSLTSSPPTLLLSQVLFSSAVPQT